MVDMNRTSTPDSRKKFEDLARELECNEDEAAFEETVKKIVQAPKAEPPATRDEKG